MNIITLFCEIDDFFLAYEKWVSTQFCPEIETRGRPRRLHPSEVMTLPPSIKVGCGHLSIRFI